LERIETRFESVKIAVKLSALRENAGRESKLPNIVGNERALSRFQFIPSSESPADIVDVHGHLLGFTCHSPIALVENLGRTADILPEKSHLS
jgi:hypothetical protein